MESQKNMQLDMFTEKSKMFDAKNAKIVSGSKLKPNDIYTGIIISVEDKTAREFIPETAHKGWRGNIDAPALNVTVEVVENDESINVTQMFTYIIEDGKTIVSDKSNLGKYNKLYKKYPEVGDHVKVITNADGFGKLKVE